MLGGFRLVVSISYDIITLTIMKIGSPRALALVIFTGLLVGLAAAARDPKEAVIYGNRSPIAVEISGRPLSA